MDCGYESEVDAGTRGSSERELHVEVKREGSKGLLARLEGLSGKERYVWFGLVLGGCILAGQLGIRDETMMGTGHAW